MIDITQKAITENRVKEKKMLTRPQIEELADTIAGVTNSVGVAYSHTTQKGGETGDQQWAVHDVGGNPFRPSSDQIIKTFDNKEKARIFAMQVRRERAIEAVEAIQTENSYPNAPERGLS